MRQVSRPALSVVLSTLGSYDTLERVLDGYDRQDAPYGSFEVVLVVDAAEPDLPAVDRAVGSRSFPLRRIRGPEPGLSANRNAGWRAADAPLVLFTDNDTIPHADLITQHLDWHTRHPEEHVCVLGHVQWAPELDITVFMRWLDTGMQFNYANLEGIDQGWSVFYGANASLKRSFIEIVGDFDQEHLPYGYEDFDWAYRAKEHGFRVMYNRDAVVDHLRTMTLEFWLKRIRRVAQAERQFCDLHPEAEPWFHGVFSYEARREPVRGRGVRLARYVSPRMPWLGPKVWASVDSYYKQTLAPHFLAAWDEYESARGAGGQPDLSEWDTASSGGRASSGPK